MPKKISTTRNDKVFAELRKKLPRRYMADLMRMLPGLDSKEIWYAMEVRCKDLELKMKVKVAMEKLAYDVQKKRKSLSKAKVK